MISKTKIAMWLFKDILLELAEFAIDRYYTFKRKITNNKCDIEPKPKDI